jgi:membrane fusion protein, multidrug efflux system
MNTAKLKFILPAVFLLVAVAVTFALIQARPVAVREEKVAPAPLVRVMSVEAGEVEMRVAAEGAVAPDTETTIVAQVGGRIDAVSPKFASGGTFRRGETIVQLDPRDYQVAAAQAQAAIAQAKLRLEREQAEAEIAREEWARMGQGEPGALVRRLPQLAEAKSAVAAAEASLMQARLNIERTTIRAPYDGLLLAKLVDVGQFVGPGTPVGRMTASDFVEIELPVSSDDLAYIDLASQPAVTVRSTFGGEAAEWRGRIVRASGQIDPRTRMLPLVARVENPFAGPVPLRIGEYVQAVIEGRSLGGVIQIPRSALRQGRQVLVVSPASTIHFRDVEILRLTSESAFLASGLQPGETIVLSAMDAPVEGMTVRTTADEPGGRLVPVVDGEPAS